MDSITLRFPKCFSQKDLFLFLDRNRNYRIECYNKKKSQNFIIMMPAGGFTGFRNAKVTQQLMNWTEQNNLGICFDSSTGFTLPDEDILSPDASWVSNEKWNMIPEALQRRFAPVCPDFIIEIRSESDKLSKLQEKMKKWLKNGCRLGFLLDFDEGKAFIYRENRKVEEVDLMKNSCLSGENVLPDFTLETRKLLKIVHL